MDPRDSHGERHTNVSSTNIDHFPSNTTHSGSSAMLYVFEDNEAVIKMIVKSRSPTMRHVSRTHRVALEWLFDRISLDPKIQIRYIDTKHQLVDILTEGSFKCDEWKNPLHLCNISHVSSICCTKNFSLISCSTMAKRIQGQNVSGVQQSKVTMLPIAEWHREWQEGGRGGRGTWASSKRTGGRERSNTSAHDYDHG